MTSALVDNWSPPVVEEELDLPEPKPRRVLSSRDFPDLALPEQEEQQPLGILPVFVDEGPLVGKKPQPESEIESEPLGLLGQFADAEQPEPEPERPGLLRRAADAFFRPTIDFKSSLFDETGIERDIIKAAEAELVFETTQFENEIREQAGEPPITKEEAIRQAFSDRRTVQAMEAKVRSIVTGKFQKDLPLEDYPTVQSPEARRLIENAQFGQKALAEKSMPPAEGLVETIAGTPGAVANFVGALLVLKRPFGRLLKKPSTRNLFKDADLAKVEAITSFEFVDQVFQAAAGQEPEIGRGATLALLLGATGRISSRLLRSGATGGAFAVATGGTDDAGLQETANQFVVGLLLGLGGSGQSKRLRQHARQVKAALLSPEGLDTLIRNRPKAAEKFAQLDRPSRADLKELTGIFGEGTNALLKPFNASDRASLAGRLFDEGIRREANAQARDVERGRRLEEGLVRSIAKLRRHGIRRQEAAVRPQEPEGAPEIRGDTGQPAEARLVPERVEVPRREDIQRESIPERAPRDRKAQEAREEVGPLTEQPSAKPPQAIEKPLRPSGLSTSATLFDTPQSRLQGYAWRLMGRKELDKLLAGEKTYGGGVAKRGNFLAPTPDSAAQFKQKGKVLVEFGGVVQAGEETVSNIIGRLNVTSIKRWNGANWVVEPIPKPTQQPIVPPKSKGLKPREEVAPTTELSPEALAAAKLVKLKAADKAVEKELTGKAKSKGLKEQPSSIEAPEAIKKSETPRLDAIEAQAKKDFREAALELGGGTLFSGPLPPVTVKLIISATKIAAIKAIRGGMKLQAAVLEALKSLSVRRDQVSNRTFREIVKQTRRIVVRTKVDPRFFDTDLKRFETNFVRSQRRVTPLPEDATPEQAKTFLQQTKRRLSQMVKFPDRVVEAREMSTEPVPEATLTKINKLLEEAKPVRAAAKVLAEQERSKREAKVRGALEEGRGLRAIHDAAIALKGKFPIPSFEPIGPKLESRELNAALNHIITSKLDMSGIERGGLGIAFWRMVDYGVLPDQSKLAQYERIFGPEFVKALVGKISFGNKALNIVGEVFGTFRPAITAYDLSATGRQAFELLTAHPVFAARAYVAQLRALASPEYADAMDRHLKTRDGAKLRKLVELAHTEFGDKPFRRSDKEELFRSNVFNLLNKAELHGAGNLLFPLKLHAKGIVASERAFTTFLNKLRADVFDSYA
ncbi:hypothetical protein LCGC14_1141730, partial [marine sediment metagenome]